MALTPYTPTTWVNDSEPDLEADNLNKIEQGIASAIDGVNGILNALTNQLSADQTKFAGIAVVNALNTALNNLSNTVSALNGNLVNQTYSFKNITITDTRNTQLLPSTYNTQTAVYEFKNGGDIGLPSGWYLLTTYKPWVDVSVPVIQDAMLLDGETIITYKRKSSGNTWGSWS